MCVRESENILSSSTNTVSPKTKLVKQKVTAEARRSRMKNILNSLDKQTELLKAKIYIRCPKWCEIVIYARERSWEIIVVRQ